MEEKALLNFVLGDGLWVSAMEEEGEGRRNCSVGFFFFRWWFMGFNNGGERRRNEEGRRNGYVGFQYGGLWSLTF